MFMVVKIQIMFPEAVHYGKDHAARRPQLQLRRVLVQCATLPAQRSESSDQRRGQETPWICPLTISWCHSGDGRLKVTGEGAGMHPHGKNNSSPALLLF